MKKHRRKKLISFNGYLLNKLSKVESDDMENWIKVLEYPLKEKDTAEWLFKLLEEEKIPYKEELKEEWIGIGKYAKYNSYVLVYAPKDYKEKVESYLKEYSNSNNIVYEDIEELKNISNYDEEVEVEQIKRDNAKKMLEWIPLGFILIIIICWIIMR